MRCRRTYQQIVRSASDTRQHLDDRAVRRGRPGGAQADWSRRRATARRSRSRSWKPACKAANEVYADISANNADFKKIYDNMVAFRSDEYLWWQVAEFTYDSSMIRARTRS